MCFKTQRVTTSRKGYLQMPSDSMLKVIWNPIRSKKTISGTYVEGACSKQ